MKIIFLDIDGVLNHHRYCTSCFKQYGGGWQSQIKGQTSYSSMLDPKALQILNDLVLKTDSYIVIISTWRRIFSWEEIEKLFILRYPEFAKGRIIGQTDNLYYYDESDVPEFNNKLYKFPAKAPRGHEIYKWINENRSLVDSFAIIDDDIDMEPYMNHYVKSNPDCGINKRACREIEKILKGNI